MILGNPVRGTIYLTPSASARWYRSQRFGCTGLSFERPYGNCAHFHRGIDVARGPAGCGDDLLAMGAGTVFYASTLDGGNRAICIRFPGNLAIGIGHLQGWAVAKGAKVAKGQKIGTVGQTGNATGCHAHVSLKTGFPATGDVNDFWRDPGAGGKGQWADVWPLLEQNVTIHPKADDGIRIRSAATTTGEPYAATKAGRIVRPDGTDLGPASEPRKYGGSVVGGSYTVDGVAGKTWDRIDFGGTYRFIARPLAVRSAS